MRCEWRRRCVHQPVYVIFAHQLPALQCCRSRLTSRLIKFYRIFRPPNRSVIVHQAHCSWQYRPMRAFYPSDGWGNSTSVTQTQSESVAIDENLIKMIKCETRTSDTLN